MHNREQVATTARERDECVCGGADATTTTAAHSAAARHTKSKRRRSSRGNSSASGLDLCLAKKGRIGNSNSCLVSLRFEFAARSLVSGEVKKLKREDENEDERATRCVVFRAFISPTAKKCATVFN